MAENIPWRRNERRGPKMLRLGDPRDQLIMSFELEKEDVMKFKPLYEGLYMFFTQEEGWKHPLSDDDKIEDLYMENWPPNGTKEQRLWWRLYKNVNQFIRYF